MDKKYEENLWTDAVRRITLPQETAAVLLQNCERGDTQKQAYRYSRVVIAAVLVLFFSTISFTSYAAYHVYQEKNVDVFFISGITEERLEEIGEELQQIGGVSSVRFVSAEEAWETFQKQYLTEDLAAQFTDNPLADSYSYRVSIGLDADTEQVREQIEALEGVRTTTDLREAKREYQ